MLRYQLAFTHRCVAVADALESFPASQRPLVGSPPCRDDLSCPLQRWSRSRLVVWQTQCSLRWFPGATALLLDLCASLALQPLHLSQLSEVSPLHQVDHLLPCVVFSRLYLPSLR